MRIYTTILRTSVGYIIDVNSSALNNLKQNLSTVIIWSMIVRNFNFVVNVVLMALGTSMKSTYVKATHRG